MIYVKADYTMMGLGGQGYQRSFASTRIAFELPGLIELDPLASIVIESLLLLWTDRHTRTSRFGYHRVGPDGRLHSAAAYAFGAASAYALVERN